MSAPSSTSSPELIGLVGAGLIGTSLAERLLAAGFDVLVWDRDAARVAAVVTLGAEAASGAAMIRERCPRIFFSLPDSNAVTSVLAEMDDLPQGSIVLDTSTGDPTVAAQLGASLAGRGVVYLDATISGSSEQLRRGEALCMVGGNGAAFARCSDLFAALGGPSLHVGASGDGARMKLITNLVLGLNRAALAEGVALAEAMGIDLARTLAVLRASAAYSRIMDTKGEKMIRGDFTPQARLSQHLKDVRLILQSGADAGLPLALSETHRQLLERAEEAQLGALDNSAIIEVMRKPSA